MNHEREKINHEDPEDHEGHETEPLFKTYSMRLPSPLSAEAEQVMTRTIGCAIAVHRSLGPGFLESIYRKAMCLELTAANLAYQLEKPISVTYRGIEISGQRVDLIVEELIVVELKAIARIDDVHRAQLISYLRTTGLRGGLLINFRVPVLQRGLRRVVV